MVSTAVFYENRGSLMIYTQGKCLLIQWTPQYSGRSLNLMTTTAPINNQENSIPIISMLTPFNLNEYCFYDAGFKGHLTSKIGITFYHIFWKLAFPQSFWYQTFLTKMYTFWATLIWNFKKGILSTFFVLRIP